MLDPDAPLLTRNSFVEEMFITLERLGASGMLEAGEDQAINNLRAKAIDEGDATITCHLHADVDQAGLFRDDVTTPSGQRAVEVI